MPSILMLFSLVTAGVLAHVGGIPTQACFDAPVGVGNVVDQQVSFGWQDNDTDPTGMFNFAYQPYNLRPNGKAAELSGTQIPNGQQVLIMDTNDVLTWDVALVIIGVTTALPSLLGLCAGWRFGTLLERRLDLVAGVVLVGLGVMILVEQLRG